jgi:hypothetical protein
MLYYRTTPNTDERDVLGNVDCSLSPQSRLSIVYCDYYGEMIVKSIETNGFNHLISFDSFCYF